MRFEDFLDVLEFISELCYFWHIPIGFKMTTQLVYCLEKEKE